jgi:hypothetical protein
MGRNTALKILNPVLGLLLVSQVTTGLSGEALPHEVFEVLHEGGGILLAIVAATHVVLNWNWIRANYGRKPKADAP